MAQIEGPFSFKAVDGLKTPAYIFLPGGERKDIGEVTVRMDNGMIFDVQLDQEYTDVETASFEVPMRYTYLNRPDGPQIEWGYNCLTTGIHHGRPEVLWNLPLLQTTHMYTVEQLKQLVVDRIYNDAMQFVEHGEEPRPSREWAEKVKEHADSMFFTRYQHTLGEVVNYYRSPEFKRDFDQVIHRNQEDNLNPGYKPLHGHDSINLLCRMLGTKASIKASQ